MIRPPAWALALLLGGCGSPAPEKAVSDGAALERAARARGLVAADGAASPVGVFRNGTDHVCVMPAASAYRIGASIDYGEGQRCVLRGRASGSERLAVEAGEGCRFEARLDGERIAFPPVLPEECDRFCSGRASLTAVTAERISDAPAEASRLRGADGGLLCAN